MAEFLKTNGICDRLESIIEGAEKELVLVSPYVQFSPNFMERLNDADKRRVKITLIYGKGELKDGEWDKLDTLRNLSLRYHPNLHAKCYYNEKQMIITSMNLYDFSEKKNREMGILVGRDADSGIYNAALKEVESIRNSSKAKKEPKGSLAEVGKTFLGVVNAMVDNAADPSRKGFCIGCAKKIHLNRNRPYCLDCYGKWNVHRSWTSAEKYCHECGKLSHSSASRPFCETCYESGPRPKLPTVTR